MMRITITAGHFCSAVFHRQGRAHTALYKFDNNVWTNTTKTANYTVKKREAFTSLDSQQMGP